MKSLSFYLVCGLLLAGTVLGGWLHGTASNRWGAQQDFKRAAEMLPRPLPSQLGTWRLVDEQKLDDQVVKMLQCPAYVNCVYINDQTEDAVNVAVILGPLGPIAVHTPEVCYSAQDYHTTNDRSKASIVDRGGQEHSLWRVRMEASEVSRPNLEVSYAWGTGGAWSATESPRFAYAGAPYLYKIQLAALASDNDDDFDPCEDFLKVFLVELQRRLVPQDMPR